MDFRTFFRCIDCEARYTYQRELKNHVKSVHEGYRWRCPECFKDFNTPSGLRCHKKIREKIHPFLCPFWFKGFTFHSTYKTHVAHHTGEKPFVCLCGKAYQASSGLSTHKKVCNLKPGEKPYTCRVCLKKFRADRYLKEHAVIHEHPTAFQCHLCGKVLKHRTSVVKHLKRKHHENKENAWSMF